MPKMTCKACGWIASAETWADDIACREAMRIVAELPPPLPPVTLKYFGLFRPASSALSWAKAQRVADDLRVLVATGYVQIQGQVARPCPPKIWAEAIEQMLDRRDRITRPLKNQNYLRQIAWGLAEQADRDREATTRTAEQTHHRPGARVNQGPQPIKSIIQQYIDGDIDHMPGEE